MLSRSALRGKLAIHYRIQGRSYHDITITGNAQKPRVSYGPPGRSAVTGQVATVFGCTGFLGRYLVSQLAKAGTQVVVPYRDEDMKRHLKVTGDLGQIVSMEWDIRDEASITECVRHSDIVYNLVGRDYETKNFDFGSVNVDGAERIARISANAGVPRLVHISHLNASAGSSSQFYATKFMGERAVRSAFPQATIIRPGPLYGHEDRLLRSMAVWPGTWKLNQERTTLKPVHVLDVAKALARLSSMAPAALVLNLPGPQTYSVEYLLELVSSVTYQPPSRAMHLPKAVAMLLSRVSGLVWWPALSPDQVERRYVNDTEGVSDWDFFGFSPDSLEAHALTYLQMYRSAENLVRPVAIPERNADGTPRNSYRLIQ